ncbi:MAG TPA: hypothetical protein VFQ36_25020 [Ktedonobacteraceae bacterium]|nr:hypothetical protein [Ktedonobacteraceae bacterium]
MSLKNFRCFISLLVLLLCILFVTGFVLVHQLDLLLSLVGNSFGICSLILATYFLYRGFKEFYADRKRNEHKNQGQVVIRLPSSLTLYDFRIGGNSHAVSDQGFAERRQARWHRGQIPLNKSIIEGLAFLAPGVKFLEYYLDRSHNTFPPGFWYTPIGLIWAYLYLVITLYLGILIAVAFIYAIQKRMDVSPKTPQGIPCEDISLDMKRQSETKE